MIHSMTGYGSASAAEEGISYSVEIRSLNNRHYKASIKLPEGFAGLETDVDRWLRAALDRGTLNFSLRVKDGSPTAAYEVNTAALRAYVSQLQGLTRGGAEGMSIDLAALLALPGVCEAPELDEEVRRRRAAVVERLTQQAVKGLLDMRRREGAALLAHLAAQTDVIRQNLAAVEQRAGTVVTEYQQRLATRVNRLLSQAQLDLDRDTLTREVAVYADRCDISEEIIRLKSHLEQFARLCNAEEAAGRKLDFLAQELLREANTIGSKANDVTIGRHIVEIKAAIERLKEQVQNVE